MLLFKYRAQTMLFLALAATYIAQITLVKPSEIALKKYGLSVMEAKLLALAIALPYILIWLIALVGYLRMKCYADTIRKTKDGQAMQYIAWGIFCLALWLPLSTVINNEATRLMTAHPSWVETTVILNNYLNLLVLAPGFILTYIGSRKLAQIAKTSVRTPNQTLVILFIVFAALYTFLVLNDPVRQAPSAEVIKATYYLPDWLIVSTIVIPRLIMWYLGMHAVQNLLLYRDRVKGSLYKIALNKFALGVCGVVIGSIVLRSFQSFSAHLASLNLGAVMLVIYLLLAILCTGYLWIYKGSGKLLYIEKL